MDNLLSGLVGALAGSAISALALMWLNQADAKRIARGAGRAVYFELAANAGICKDPAVPGTTLSRRAWDDYQARLALFLSPTVFRATAKPYLLMPLYEVVLKRKGADEAATSRRVEFLEEARKEFLRARGVLQPWVWSAKELAILKPESETTSS